MSIKQLLEMTEVLANCFSNISKELRVLEGLDVSSEVKKVQLTKTSRKSGHQKRLSNEKALTKIKEIFSENPKRGFTLSDLGRRVGHGVVSYTTTKNQLRYLQGVDFIEKIGNAYRLSKSDEIKKPTKRKIKKSKKSANGNGHGTHDSSDRQARILQALQTGPMTTDNIRKTLSMDFYKVREATDTLKKDGLIKTVKVSGRPRFALPEYQPQA